MNRLQLACIALVLAVPMHLHSGRTDSNGGHYDRSTGEYHYHHGYEAHQHKDLDGDGKLDCPFEFKNQTSTRVTYYSSPTPATSPTSTVPTKPRETQSQPERRSNNAGAGNGSSSDGLPGWVYLSWGAFVVIIFLMMLSKSSDNSSAAELRKRYDDLMAEKRKIEADAYATRTRLVNNLSDLQKILFDTEAKLRDAESSLQIALQENKPAELPPVEVKQLPVEEPPIVEPNPIPVQKEEYSDEYLLRLCGMPAGSYIGDDGKPHSSIKPYDKYDFCVSSTGKIHRTYCFHAEYSKVYNIVDIGTTNFHNRACRTCRPYFPDISWYYAFLQMKRSVSSPQPKKILLEERSQDVYEIQERLF